jgi:phosphonate transport system permease protein
MKKHISEMYDKRPKTAVKNLIILLSVFVISAWSLEVINYGGLSDNGIGIARNIMLSFLNPNWNMILDTGIGGVPFLMFETLGISFLGTILGAVLSVPFAFLSARNIVGKFSFIGVTLITVIRSFPFFILALMFIRVSGPGPFTGVMTISILSIGMISKLYIEAIEDIDMGIIQALDSTGASSYQKIRYGIIPQLTVNFISTIIYRFEINVKNATVLGLVGAGGIGFTLLSAMTSFRWSDAAAALWGIIIVVFIIEYASNKIRKKLVNG